MDPYSRRTIDEEIDELSRNLSALVLEGPKGVGKTATATQRASTIHNLDDPALANIGAAEPTRLLEGDPPVLIDEWQRVPQTWDLVRRAVDAGAPPGSFFLTGSATPALSPTHSGAGRIVTIRMRPLTFSERRIEKPTVSLSKLLKAKQPKIDGTSKVNLQTYTEEIVHSGFPGLRQLSGRSLRAQLDSYLQRIAERDFLEMGHAIRNPAALQRWMMSYAAATSTTASYETIRDAATSGHGDKPSKTTTQPFRDILQRLWIIEPVQAWLPSRNYLLHLSSPPKHQFADPALAARLLGADTEALLDAKPLGPAIPRQGPLLGALFEALVTLDIRVAAQASECRVKHLRTARGDREIDLIVERGDGRILAIEVKLARDVDDSDVRHLLWLKEQLGDDLLDTVIVTSGPHAYRRKDGVAVVPLALLGP
jgi:uncharacterized protein